MNTPQPIEEGNHFHLKRRFVLGMGASLAMLGVRPLHAQSQEQYAQLGEAFEGARRVREYAVGIALEEIDSEIIQFLEMDFFERQRTLAVARESGLFVTADSAQVYVSGIPDFLPDVVPLGFDQQALSSQQLVIAALTEDGLPIAPPPELVTPANIAPAPPYGEPESDLIVVVDILLETIGISIGDASLIVSLIESDEALQSALEELLVVISTKEWQEVVGLAEAVFKLLVASQVWIVIKERVGKKLTWRLALKAVPVVGWLYCGAAFIVSVKKNYYRFSFA